MVQTKGEPARCIRYFSAIQRIRTTKGETQKASLFREALVNILSLKALSFGEDLGEAGFLVCRQCRRAAYNFGKLGGDGCLAGLIV